MHGIFHGWNRIPSLSVGKEVRLPDLFQSSNLWSSFGSVAAFYFYQDKATKSSGSILEAIISQIKRNLNKTLASISTCVQESLFHAFLTKFSNYKTEFKADSDENDSDKNNNLHSSGGISDTVEASLRFKISTLRSQVECLIAERDKRVARCSGITLNCVQDAHK